MSDNDDSLKSCQQTRQFLQILGLIPRNLTSSSTTKYFLLKKTRVIHSVILLWMSTANIAHILLRENDKNKKILLVGPISYEIMSFLKLCAMYYREKIIGQCVEYIEDDWRRIENEKHRELMRKNMKWGKQTTLACAILMYIGGVSYNLIMPASEHISSDKSGRMPVFSGYDIAFDCQKPIIYEIIFILYMYGVFIAHTVTIVSNHLAILALSHINGQFEILEEYSRRLTDAVKFEKLSFHQEIAIIISHHCRTLKFSKIVKKVLYEICLIDVLISTLLICLGEYSILQMWKNQEFVSVASLAVLTIGLTMSPFIFCWISEIMSKRFSISNLVYNIEWYDLPIQDRKCFILVLLTAQCLQKIDAGIMELSFVAFTSIFKTAVGYFQMLRTMNT